MAVQAATNGRFRTMGAALLTTTALAAIPVAAFAQVVNFNSTADSGAGSFRDAVDQANSTSALDTIESLLTAPDNTITLTSGTVNIEKTTPLLIDGVEAFTIVRNGSPVLGTSGGGIDLTIGENVTINGQGAFAYGVWLRNGGNLFTLKGAIDNLGTMASGVYAEGDFNTVLVEGDILTIGSQANGVYIGGNDARVTLEAGSAITTDGAGANGISVSGNDAIISISGRIESLGTGTGIWTGGTGHDITLTGSAEIVTHDLSAIGIRLDGGDGLVESGATITTFSSSAIGISSYGTDNTIDVAGGIATNATGATGIVTYGDRSHTFLRNGGTISTNGLSANAIHAWGDESVIDVAGAIITQNNDAAGIKVESDDSTVTLSGSIETNGSFSAAGIYVVGENNTVTLASGASITSNDNGIALDGDGGNTVIMQAGSEIDITGDQDAIFGYGEGNIYRIGGHILTGLDDARGVALGDANGTVTLEDTGLIHTRGDGAVGVDDAGGAGGHDIAIHGAIQTEGNEAHGVRGQGDGNTVILSGAITTSGVDADGINFDNGTTGNRLELHSGFTLSAGGSLAQGGGAGTLTLGGAGADSFDISQIGATNGYVGFAGFDKRGTSTWTLTSANTAVDWTVREGTLLVNGATGEMDILSGATLGGNGSVGTAVVRNGGTISPGAADQIDTLHVAGDLTFEAGSTYVVHIDAPDQADLISVAGTATIDGGTVQVEKLSAGTSYMDGQTYRLLTATSLVDNAEFTLSQPFLFLDAELIYGGSFVDLKLMRSGSFNDVALTFNQFQAATALDGLAQNGDALGVFNEFLAMTDADEARRAYDLTSGEIHATGQHVINQTFQLFSRTLRQQASAGVGNGLAGTEVISTPMNMLSAYGPSTPSSLGVRAIDSAARAHEDARVQGAWAAPLGARGTIDGDGNAGALDWWTLGVAGGYEGIVDVGSGEAIAGLAFGYLRSGGTVDARMSSMDADGFHLGAYGAWTDGQWSLAASTAYAANYVSTHRRIAFGAIDRSAEANYWNHTVGLSTELAYAIETNSGLTISPLFTLDAGWTGHGGYSETGAAALGLTAAGQGYGWLDTGLGIALAHTIETESGKVTFDGRAVWEHAFAGAVPGADHLLAGSPVGFSVKGPDAGNDRLRLGAGVAFEIGNELTIRARYDGLFSGSQQSHAGSLGLNVKF